MLGKSTNRAPRRKLIPNLFSNILKVIAESDRPLTQHEIVEAVSKRMERSDEELKRQITVNLHDALIYGYLRVKNYRYSIVPKRLDPNEPRTSRASDAGTLQEATTMLVDNSDYGRAEEAATCSAAENSGERQLGLRTDDRVEEFKDERSAKRTKIEARESVRERENTVPVEPGTETEEETGGYKTDLQTKPSSTSRA